MADLIAISGKLGHGKDTFADIIIEELKKQDFKRKVQKLAFANPIKEAVSNMFPQLDTNVLYGPSELRKTKIEGFINPETGETLTVRNVLTQLGAFGRRYCPNIWILSTMATAQKLISNGYIVIIVDGRFINEISYIKLYGGKVIRIVRPDITFTINDQSETDLDNYHDFDKVIINDTFENLHKSAIEVINEHIL